MQRLKSLLSKLNFFLGRNPKLIHHHDYTSVREFIPEPYKAVFILSADFELAWAWRYMKGSESPLLTALEKARQARKNISEILDLCDRFNISITWAVVGHLFLETCAREKGIIHPEIKRPSFSEDDYRVYEKGDWFQHDPCSNYIEAPEWYAPDIIKDILQRKTRHEIACHTFSHIDCRDEVCSPGVLISEIEACQKAAGASGVELKSFIHPGHTIGNLDTLKKMGFNSFRTDYQNTLGYPVHHKNGLWEFKSTVELGLRREWTLDYHIYRFNKIIERAIKHKKVCYSWFHPSMDSILVEKVLPGLFSFISSQREREELWVTTTKNYVKWLENGRL
ncbi:MAG: polysaccharide deacetylase family protein [Candidatus Aminicenantes bacterium]|jgi:peptidoglycan/xylan/chitin deacetylase (PgdA/CDA1 family)